MFDSFLNLENSKLYKLIIYNPCQPSVIFANPICVSL